MNVLWVFSAFIEALYSEDVIIFGVFLFSDIPQAFPHIYVHPVYLLVYSAQSILHKKYILHIFSQLEIIFQIVIVYELIFQLIS